MVLVEVLLYSQGSQAIQAIQATHQVVVKILRQGNQHSLGNLLTHQQHNSSVVEAVVVVLETK